MSLQPPTLTLELDRSSGTPLHSQLFEHYRRLIEAGTLPVGGRLPTEMALMDLHGLSRGTVRQALKSLSDAGLVRREPKNGTVVSPPRAAHRPAAPCIIGVIFPEARDAFCMDIMKGVQAACRKRGFHAAFGYSHEDSAVERAEVVRMRRAGFGGVLVLPHDDPALFAELAADGYPFVYLDQRAAVPGDFVGVDNVSASFGATAHLLGRGFGRVAFLHKNHDLNTAPSTVQDRFRGYRGALAAHGRAFDPAWVLSTAASPGYLETLRQNVRAVVAVNDFTALELIKDAAEAGLRVPADLAVVGFDDLPQAAGFSLTTVAQPSFEIGRRAAELLIARLAGDAGPAQRVLLPTRLVVRGSSGTG